jgi:hypothetical protein
MNDALRDIASYSEWVYRLPERNSSVRSSTLALVPIGPKLAKLAGQLECGPGIVIEAWELIDFSEGRIRNYSYEVYRESEKICWYDHWPHPELPSLSATFPHHKHVLPNLRENRIPAVGIGFQAPNLEVVLGDLSKLVAA